MKDPNRICNSITVSPAEIYFREDKNLIKFKLYIDEGEVDEIETAYNTLPETGENNIKPFGQAQWAGLEYIYNDEEYDYRLLLERVILYNKENNLYYDLIGKVDGLSFVKTNSILRA